MKLTRTKNLRKIFILGLTSQKREGVTESMFSLSPPTRNEPIFVLSLCEILAWLVRSETPFGSLKKEQSLVLATGIKGTPTLHGSLSLGNRDVWALLWTGSVSDRVGSSGVRIIKTSWAEIFLK